MALILLVLTFGFSAGALASFLGTAAGSVACDVFLLGAAAGCLVVRPAPAARVPAFPPRPAFQFAMLGVLAVGAAAQLPIEAAVVPIVAAGVLLGRCLQALVFYFGAYGVPRSPGVAGLVLGAVVAPATLAAAGSVSDLLAAAVAAAAPLVFAIGARTATAAESSLPAPNPEPALAGMPTLVGVLVVGAGFARLVDDAPTTLFWVGAGAVAGALLLPYARRAGVVLGACALLTVAFLGIALDRAPETPWLGDATLRAAVASALLGLGVVSLPRLYATLPAAPKLIGPLENSDRPVQDGAVRRVALFGVGLVLGRARWFDGVAPWIVFAVLAAGGAALVWFDPRAGIGRRLKVLAFAGVAAAVGVWLVRDVG